MKNKIGVVGSINTDLVVTTRTLPKVGETVTGDEFKICFGGKGCNEAVAAARLGAKVNLFSAVGEDLFSQNILAHLDSENVSLTGIKKIKGMTGGIANITVCNKNNQIIVVPGTNALVDTTHILAHKKEILECGIIGGMFEIPIETLVETSKICKENNIKFVLNPSPVKEYPLELFENATYVIVNEMEIEKVNGYNPKNPTEVLLKFPNKLILTKGADGCYYSDGKKVLHIPAIKVQVVDTTGAGDTFLGSFMFAINNGLKIEEALTFANICAGLKTTILGAQTGMPKIEKVLTYIKKNKIKIDIQKLKA